MEGILIQEAAVHFLFSDSRCYQSLPNLNQLLIILTNANKGPPNLDDVILSQSWSFPEP